MKKMKHLLCLLMACLLLFTSIPFADLEVQAAGANYSLTCSSSGEGILMNCNSGVPGVAKTFSEWFNDPTEGTFYRVTTGNCTASEASNGMSKKILVIQADYNPSVSSGSLKNGVFTPHRQYWKPTESGTYKVWKMRKNSNGVFAATDTYCISFYVKVTYTASVRVRYEDEDGNVLTPLNANGGVSVETLGEFGNYKSFDFDSAKNYTVSAKSIPGFKVKSISHTSVGGRKDVTIEVVYVVAEACSYKVESSAHGMLLVDSKTGSFNGAVGVPVSIVAFGSSGGSGNTLRNNTIEGIYVNGEKLSNITLSNNDYYATASYTPNTTGNFVVSVKYHVNELVGDTSKVFICNDPRNNATALELFEHVYGAALEKLPEEGRPQVTTASVKYFAGQRYTKTYNPVNGSINTTYSDDYLTFSENLKGSYTGLLGEGNGYVGTPHLFAANAGETGIATERIKMDIPASATLPAGSVIMNLRVTKYGMTLNDEVTICKSDNAYSAMVEAVDAKFRGNSSDLFVYTDKAGATIDQQYLMNVRDGETIDVIVEYPGDATYGAQKKTVSLTVYPGFGIQVENQVVEKVYDGTALTVNAENGAFFTWTEHEGLTSKVSVLYYNNQGKLLAKAPTEAGNYVARLQVSDSYGTEISKDCVIVTIHPAEVEFYFSTVPVKTYGDDDFKVLLQNVPEGRENDILYDSENENIVTVDNNGNVSIVGAGMTNVTATLPATANYAETIVSAQIIVNKANPVLKFAEVADQTCGDQVALQIIEQSEGMGAIRYYTMNGSIANVGYESGVVTADGAGEAVILAKYEETANYLAGSVSIRFNVLHLEGTVEAQAEDKVYDRETAKVTYTTNNEKGRVIKEYKRTYEEDSAYTTTMPIDVGTYTVRVTVQETGKYSQAMDTAEFTIYPAEIMVDVIEAGEEEVRFSKTYDGTNAVEVRKVAAGGICTYYGYSEDEKRYTWISEDVAVDVSNAKAFVSGADVGYYDEMTITGLTLTGEDAKNYVIAEEVVCSLASENFIISEAYITYELENQTIHVDDVFTDEYGYVQQDVYVVDGETKDINELIDTTKYSIDESNLIEGHHISSVSLYASAGVITMTFGVEDSEGNDVTYNYHTLGHSGMIDIVIDCEDHEFDENGFCPNCVNYEPAQGTADEFGSITYDIYNAGQFFWFAKQVNDGINRSAQGRLWADIDLNPGYTFHSDGTVTFEGDKVTSGWRAWTPIGDQCIYSGSFDGRGHLISGVYIVKTKSKAGVFGWIDYNPTIKDMHLTNSYIKGKEHVGAIGGYFYANMENCTVDTSVTVVGENWVGGFAGHAGNGSINNCASAATVITTGNNTNSAGLVGYNYSHISNSYCTKERLVGYNYETYGGFIENCFYLDESGEEDEYEGTTAVTAEQFASGEITYLLQAGQKAEEEWDDELQDYVEVGAPKQIWGQNIDLKGFDEYDPLPVLHGPKVYMIEREDGQKPYYSNAELIAEEEKEPVTKVFADVNEGAWYVENIQYVYDRGIMSGSNGLFNPDGNITKAQVVATLYKKEGSPAITDFKACTELIDVQRGEWYTNAVCWAYNTGVGSGNTSTKMFNMNAPVTRQQLAAFFYKYAAYKGLDISASADISEMLNADQVSFYAETAVKWAVAEGIITGSATRDANGNTVYDLKPTATATRAQMATILARFCEKNNL